jgi:hypothetical protein
MCIVYAEVAANTVAVCIAVLHSTVVSESMANGVASVVVQTCRTLFRSGPPLQQCLMHPRVDDGPRRIPDGMPRRRDHRYGVAI